MRKTAAFILLAIMSVGTQAATPKESPLTVDALAGTLTQPSEAAPDTPVVLIVPGSGPTDRDGNSPLGIKAATYRRLAEALAAQGIASVRIDKRGMFGSSAAIADADAVTIADYAEDVRRWITAIRARTGATCVWIAGHSEGALVAEVAARKPDGICGLVLIAAPGRRFSDVLLSQLEANPANAQLLPAARRAVGDLAAGRKVDTTSLPESLRPLFPPRVQGFLISAFGYDPAALLRTIQRPVLILQGEADLQVSAEDARRLHAAQPNATLVLLPFVTHVLKAAPADDRAANLATYTDPDMPLAPGVADSIVGFIRGHSRTP